MQTSTAGIQGCIGYHYHVGFKTLASDGWRVGFAVHAACVRPLELPAPIGEVARFDSTRICCRWPTSS
jgi:hypothetical protein